MLLHGCLLLGCSSADYWRWLLRSYSCLKIGFFAVFLQLSSFVLLFGHLGFADVLWLLWFGVVLVAGCFLIGLCFGCDHFLLFDRLYRGALLLVGFWVNYLPLFGFSTASFWLGVHCCWWLVGLMHMFWLGY